MGAKTWMIVYADREPRELFRAQPALDHAATEALARSLFPDESFGPAQESDLGFTCPGRDERVLGCFDGVSVVAANEFLVEQPAELPQRFVEHGRKGIMILHGMVSAVDGFVFGYWRDGVLIRWLCVTPDDGIVADIGDRLSFEQPFWNGRHSVEIDEGEAPYPLPFHPLEMANAALSECFGYQLEGIEDPSLFEPWTIPLLLYRRSRRPWWAFWR